MRFVIDNKLIVKVDAYANFEKSIEKYIEFVWQNPWPILLFHSLHHRYTHLHIHTRVKY